MSFTSIPMAGAARSLWWLMLLLWVLQAWRPLAAYPATGVLLMAAVATTMLVSGMLLRNRLRAGTGPLRNPAALAGCVFLGYIASRWSADNFAAAGAESFSTLMGTGVWAWTSYALLSLASMDGSHGAPRQRVRDLLLAVVLLSLACTAHAIAQYAYLYDRHARDLLEVIGQRSPSPTEEALLYHFRLKRVASIWGDPNIFAGFSALAFAAALYLLRVPRLEGGSRWWALAGGAGAAASLVSIGLSGSRGGILDILAVLALFGFEAWRRRRKLPRSAAVLPAAAALVILCGANGTTVAPEAAPSSWSWRSNTIRERLNYADVGMKMIQTRPMDGMGLGSVNLYFGRLKPPEARESKYLHNWLLQLGAETGLLGAGLAVLFLVLLFWNAHFSPRGNELAYFATAAMAGVLVLDALLQLSFNHRELMALFGMLCGVLLYAGARPSNAQLLGEVKASLATLALLAAIVLKSLPALSAAATRLAASDALDARELQEARRLIARAQKQSPRDPAAYLLQAEVEETEGNLAAAERALQKARALQPESAAVHAALAHVLARQGDTSQSMQMLQIAWDKYPSSPTYNYQMAVRAVERGDTKAAETFAERAATYGAGLPGDAERQALLQKIRAGKP